MKKVSFMVAFLAIIQITLGVQLAEAQQRLSDRRTVEEALDVAGEDIGKELEELFEQLGVTAEKIGEKLEKWAEENSEELDAWSQKYGDQWERFGNRLSRTMEGISADQEDVWNRWASRYEQSLQSWADQLDSDELNAKNVGAFVDKNLEMLSRMPLGQLVDQMLEDGVNEFRSAPWESIDELGRLAKNALEEPMEELGSLTIEGSRTKRALERSAREMGKSLEQLKQDIGRNISDSDARDLLDDRRRGEDPRIKALTELLKRDNITEEQRNRAESMIDAIRSIESKSRGNGQNSWTEAPKSRQKRVDVPRRDQILERIEREKKRHAEALESFNDDLRRSSEESQRMERQKSNQRWQAEEARKAKRADGKALDPNSRRPSNAKKDPLQWFRDDDGRQPRRAKQGSQRPQNPNKNRSAKSSKWEIEEIKSQTDANDDLKLLQKQIEELRKEIQRLKKDK